MKKISFSILVFNSGKILEFILEPVNIVSSYKIKHSLFVEKKHK